MKYKFNITMCQDTCELIHVKLGMMLNTSRLYSLIQVWMILMLTQGLRAMGKVALSSHCVVKLHVVTQMFMMADYAREMTMK